MDTAPPDPLSTVYHSCRRALISYVTRMVLRPEVAEEIVQQAVLNLIEADNRPLEAEGMRAMLFKAASRLAIDHLRRHGTWREDVMEETRLRAEADAGFMTQSAALRGSPEMSSIARQHLAVCLSCTMRNLLPQQAAALLLVEVYGFTVDEAAGMCEASFGQVKNWLQSARAALGEKYKARCALINKQGVCHECSELSEFFLGRRQDPLEGSARDLDARLAIVREQREEPLDRWHRLVMRITADLLGQGGR